MSNKEQEIDPSIYLYDEVYDEIKGNDKKDDRSRSRSREKEKKKEVPKPKHSKYIGRMKQMVNERQKDHEIARQSKIKKQNERMGVNEEMVFVTESYLKQKEEEK